MINKEPPGPRGLPVLGNMIDYVRDPLAFLQRMHRDFPKVACIKLTYNKLYLVTDPLLVEEVLLGKHRECVKDRLTRELIPLIGHSILTTDGEPWRKRRKLSSSPFSPRGIAAYADMMVECTERHAVSYRDGEQRSFHREIMGLTLEVVGKTILGFDPHTDAKRIGDAMDDTVPYFESILFSLSGQLGRVLPTPARRRFVRAKRELDQVVADIVRRAQSAGKDADFLLARLAHARDEDGLSLTPEELESEAITFLLAGHETTALSIQFVVYALTQHPEIAARVREELDRVLGGRPVTLADLPQLTLLKAVIKETLRLYPAAPQFGRQVAVPFYLAGYEFEPGDTILFSPYALHRDPRYYREPDRFDPDRFLDGSCDNLPKFVYFPFGGGPRVCIGQHFALMEAEVMLATLLQRLEFQTAPGFKMELAPAITLRSRHGLPVIAHRRPVPGPVRSVRSSDHTSAAAQ